MTPEAPKAALDLAHEREELFSRARSGAVRNFPASMAHLVDTYFTQRLADVHYRIPALATGEFVLAAVGGYGRGELCPHSDLDILLIFPKRIPKDAEDACKKIFYPLWDLRFDLGHGVRTISDCVKLAKSDFQVLTSLLDARFLGGSGRIFQAFNRTLADKALHKRALPFARWLTYKNQEREQEFGDASALLQPDLKNGLGGLRDVHQIFWLTRMLELSGLRHAIFLPEDLAMLRRDQDTLLAARTALHLVAGRHTDKLHFDLQPQVAELLGFAAKDQSALERGRNVEFFLSRLSGACTRIKAMRRGLFQETSALEKGGKSGKGEAESLGQNIVSGPAGLSLASQPRARALHVLELFRKSGQTGRPLTWGATRFVRERMPRWAERLGPGKPLGPEALDLVLELATAPHGGQALEAMLECGLLAAILPVLGRVQNLVQFDDYHVHPVGRHTLNTLTLLGSFLSGRVEGSAGFAGELAKQVRRSQPLLLAALFHDLGKEEGHHAEVGADLALEVLPKFSIPRSVAEEAAFLVRHHLLIPKTATSRDLGDESVTARVAEICGSPERLVELYLLSVADSMATGPRAWSQWTASLFAECYFKARNSLVHGTLAGPDAARLLAESRDAVRSLADKKSLPAPVVEEGLERMGRRALRVFPPEKLVAQIELAMDLEEALALDRVRKPSASAGLGVVRLSAAPGRVPGCTELTIAAMDRPGLFAAIVGVMVLQGLDVLSAEVFTWKPVRGGDGLAMDVLTVADPPGGALDDRWEGGYWSRLTATLSGALSGSVDLAYRVAERRASPLTASRATPRLPAEVRMDEVASDFHTVVEVSAPDRLGLLFDLATAIAGLGLNIHLARIATSHGKVADVFFLRGPHGGKITDPDELARLRETLVQAAKG